MTHLLLSRWHLGGLGRFSGVATLVAASCLPAATSLAQEREQNRASRQAEADGQAIRTGDGMLSVQANLPQEVRIGEQFTYDVTVQNTTDNVSLHQIKLRHREQGGLTIESVSMQGQQQGQQKQDQQKQDQQKQDQQKQDQQKQDQQKQDQQKQGQQKQDQQKQGQQSKAGGQGKSLSIQELGPGESRTFQVTASTSQEGAINACLIVESYQPAICLQTKAVKPELEIVKTAPDKGNQCDVIELVYTVKNGGTGTVGEFEIIDELAQGLRTIDGQDRLAFTVDQLEAGETRKFVASVYATKTGEFKSRATAKAKQADLKSRSENVGPNVVGADLRVKLDGGGAVYSNEPAIFTAHVTNSGNAPAEGVRVMVRFPEQANLRQISAPQLQQGQSQSSNKQQQQQTAAMREQTNQGKQQASGQQKSSQQKQSSDQPMSEEQFAIERLEPGQTAQFNYVLTARGMEEIPTEVEAQYVCAVEQAQDEAQVRKVSIAKQTVRVVRLPALQIYAIDDADPVAIESKVTYTIRVKNEGDATDKNVQITAKLPKQLKFDSAQGPSKHKQESQQIVFEPLDQLAAGDEVEYTLTATAQEKGNVKLEVQLQSDSLDSKVQSDEPTQLFEGQASN